MPSPPIPEFVRTDLDRLEIALGEEVLAALGRFLDLLLEANRRFNLTSIRDRGEAWRRHIINSLTLLPFLEDLPSGARLIDVGTGGGLPGIPIALARPDLDLVLLEATGKKAVFCRQCAAELSLDLEVIHDRAERIGHDRAHREHYAAAVSRAIGPMREQLEYTLPLLRVGGRLLAMKGPKAREELEQAADALDILGAGELNVYDAYPPQFGQGSVVVAVTKRARTPGTFPRAPGTPRKSPL